MNREEKLTIAREVLELESQTLADQARRLGDPFLQLVEWIIEIQGRVIVTGIGKSGAVAGKLASTLACTGTPSLFLHPVEALHGDLGIVTKCDLVIVFSHSGNTEEVLAIIPSIRRIGAKIVGFTGDPKSRLAQLSDLVVPMHIEREACPYNLVPTASTTAMLAMGDALAITVMRARRFTREQFASFHPAGSIGRAMLRVSDVMHAGKGNPTIGADATVEETLLLMMSAEMRGIANVTSPDGKLLGVFTDGDLRRHLKNDPELLHRRLGDIMTRDPTTISPDKLATEALALMEERELDNLPVVNSEGYCVGLIDVQDLLKAKVV